MKRLLTAAGAALALSLAFAPSAQAEDVIVVDAPDIQKLGATVPHFSLDDAIGQKVYTNAGRKLGEVENFIITEGGYLYAVIEVEEDANETLLPLEDGERVVVPWDQLRVDSETNLSMKR